MTFVLFLYCPLLLGHVNVLLIVNLVTLQLTGVLKELGYTADMVYKFWVRLQDVRMLTCLLLLQWRHGNDQINHSWILILLCHSSWVPDLKKFWPFSIMFLRPMHLDLHCFRRLSDGLELPWMILEIDP